jgi:citrate synthase
MNVFWREAPLNEAEAKLLQLTLDAHAASAQRDNISSVVLVNTAIGSGELTKALSAALATLGGAHAPLEQTHAVLTLEPLGHNGGEHPIPGWGNSFVKGAPDPIWKDVDAQLGEVAPEVYTSIVRITSQLHDAGKLVWPNPSAYTAAVGIALGLPAPLLSWLFIQGRLAVWTLIFQNVTKGAA